MRCRVAIVALTLLGAAVPYASGSRQPDLPPGIFQSVDKAVRTAFSHLLALPRDTDAADLGKWVLDSSATLAQDAPPRQWIIAAQHLADTGRALKLNEEILRQPSAATARQLADSVLAIQRLEKEISKLDAESRVEVVIEVNADDVNGSDNAGKPVTLGPSIAALAARHARGGWRKSNDAGLGMEVERWVPATLFVAFGSTRQLRTTTGDALHNVVVRARGNDEMVERIIKETNWQALAALVK